MYIKKASIRFLILISIFPVFMVFSAKFYKWTDKNGNVYFTDNPANIPEEYRKSTQKIENEKKEIKEEINSEEKNTTVKIKNICFEYLDFVMSFDPPMRMPSDAQSENIYREAIKCFPESNEIKFEAGTFLYVIHKNKEAEMLFNELYNNNYKKADTLFFLIQINQGLQSIKKAIKFMEEFLVEENPDSNRISLVKSWLKQTKNKLRNRELAVEKEKSRQEEILKNFEKK